MHENQLPMQKWICMRCPQTSHVEGDQFLKSQHAWACWDMIARAIVFLNSQTDSQMYTFPDQMNGQLVQIMASKLPSQPSSSSIYYMNLS